MSGQLSLKLNKRDRKRQRQNNFVSSAFGIRTHLPLVGGGVEFVNFNTMQTVVVEECVESIPVHSFICRNFFATKLRRW